jgi:hypothetical protein
MVPSSIAFPDHDVEPRLGGGGADAAGPAHVEVAPGDLGAPEDVLLGRHALDRVERRLVVPGEMRVGLDHARHQEGAGAVDHRAPTIGAARMPLPGLDDTADPVALDQHLAHERRLAAAVEDADVGVVDVGHRSVPF